VLEPGQSIQAVFENNSDQFGEVTFIVTPWTIDADENLVCDGVPIYVTITVEPTPKVTATPTEQTICDGAETSILLGTVTTASRGVRFQYEISEQDGNVDLVSGGSGILEPGQSIQAVFENTSDQFGEVTFIVTPWTIDADENLVCDGVPIYVTITVEPTPKVTATPTEQTICDGAETNILLTTPTTASLGVRFQYSIFDQDANINLVSGGSGVLEPGQSIQAVFENNSDDFGQVTFIVTPWTIDADENLVCDGVPIYVTITVEPTPKVTATPTEQTICDGAETNILLTTPTTASLGVRFQYSIFDQDANINLVSGGSGVLEPGQSIQAVFENNSDQFGEVTFIVTPWTIDADENLVCDGVPIYVTITVEPTPKVTATPTEQTICDGAETNILLTTPTTASLGVRFQYSIFDQDANINLISGGSGILEPGQSIQAVFENTSDQFGEVTFIVTPWTIDADENLVCDGVPIYVTITVEPTPKVTATPTEQTICDGAETNILLTTPTTASLGVRFQYSIFDQDANINLVSGGSGVLEPAQSIQAVFENNSDQFGEVTFIVTPWTIDADENLVCDGVPIYVTITVEPTPKVTATPTEQTICDGAETNILLTTPTTASLGVRFQYSIFDQDANINLVSGGSGVLEPGQSIQAVFENNSDQFGEVTFIVTPWTIDADENLVCDGVPIYVTITVEPTPKVTATPTEQTICDGAETNILLTTPTTASLGVRFQYSIFDQDANINLVSGGSGVLEPGQSIQAVFENNSDQFGEVTFIVTPWTIDADENLVCDGVPIYVTITVEPTPKVTATPTEQTICNDGITAITLTTPTTVTSGVVTFDYIATATGGPGAVTGFTGSAPNLDHGHVIADQINNSTNEVQYVTYLITPRALDTGCTEGETVTVVIAVNPTPQLSAVADETIYCDSSVILIRVNDLLGNVHGDKIYHLTTTNTGGVTGVLPEGEYAAGMNITDQLVNPTNEVQEVTYRLSARIRNPAGPDSGYCDGGTETTITVFVNPTPLISVTIDDTVYCDESEITFNIADLNGTVIGDKIFTLTTTYQEGQVEGVQAGGDYERVSITSNLRNLSNEVQIITYNFKAQIKDPRGQGTGYCSEGGDFTFAIYLNPTPIVTTNLLHDRDTICTGTLAEIELTSPTSVFNGVITFDYTVTPSGNTNDITGYGPGAYNMPQGTFIRRTLVNNTTIPQYVTYRVTPKALSTGCVAGIPTDVVIRVHPNPIDSFYISKEIECFGTYSGSLAMATATGSGPYTIRWTGPDGFASSEKNLEDIRFGRYNLRVTDANNCVEGSIRISDPDPIAVNFDAEQISCFGGSDGTIQITTVREGAGPPYSFHWKGPEGFVFDDNTTRHQANLVAGQYEVIITDVKGCQYSSANYDPLNVLLLSEPDPISIYIDVTDATCNINDDGSMPKALY
jgi:hypothetical protein